MGNVMETMGKLATAFLKGLSEIWAWMTSPLYVFGFQISIGGWQVVPIQVFGVGFATVLVAVFIKSIVTW